MEPFSLLPFLQSLIRAQTDDTQTVSTSQKPDEESAQLAHNSAQNEPPQNACLQFFSMHDERVKRTKKP